MVLRRFSTSSLEVLSTEEHLELLDSVDTLRLQGISHYISLPQIIVCGDQSSGKSSVLEAISGVSFPVRSSLCTRFPTELVLRKSAQTGVSVSIVPHRARSDVEQEALSRFHEELESFEAFSNDLLRVEVSGPDRPHLTIADLPGLIHSETKQQSAADVALVQDVVQSYMKEPRSIIIAVVSAKNDFANQIILRLAREADPSGKRTLGVITKPDALVQGSESEAQFVSLAKNQEVDFRLGWHVLKNMDTEKGTWSLSIRSKQEIEFFSTGVWVDLPRSHVGINTLRERLSRLLLGQIAAELPSLMSEIQVKIDECVKKLEKLGEPRTTLQEQRSYLLHISQSFQNLVKAGLDGSYNDPFFGSAHSESGYQKRMRAVIQNLSEDFAQIINENGHYRHISNGESDEKTSNLQLFVTREQYLQHIERLLRRTRGRELPGTFNPMIVKDLFKEQSQPWQKIAKDHVAKAWEAAKIFIYAAVTELSDMATSSALLKDVFDPALDKLLKEMEMRLDEMLEPHRNGHAITYNHYFTDNLQKSRRDVLEGEFSKVLTHFFNVTEVNTFNTFNFENTFDLRSLLDSLLKSSETDMIRFATREALDCHTDAVWVALKRFIDGVATDVVETALAKSIDQLFSPIVVYHMPDTLVARIAEESKENRDLRDQLSKKLKILGKGSATCRKFVNIQQTAALSSSLQRISVPSNNTGNNSKSSSDDVVSLSESISSPEYEHSDRNHHPVDVDETPCPEEP
ncbi:hypothetical protein BBP40_007005 [Aspergillus hancockii]|nr:hypothetical protein BBP40_007005 [Aspergillus hancockii]